MIRTLLLAATAGVACGAALAPVPARAQALPNGSYKSSCTNIRFKTGDPYMLVATCRPKADDTAAAVSMLNISPCRDGTILNENGKLKCPFDQYTQDVSDATRNHAAFAAAGIIIMGRDPDLATTIKWMRFGYAHTRFISELDRHTLDFGEAAQILKQYLVQQATPQERRDVFLAAYRQVYGSSTGIIFTGTDYDPLIKAGKAWYATIVTAERARRNAPPAPAPAGTAPPPVIH